MIAVLAFCVSYGHDIFQRVFTEFIVRNQRDTFKIGRADVQVSFVVWLAVRLVPSCQQPH